MAKWEIGGKRQGSLLWTSFSNLWWISVFLCSDKNLTFLGDYPLPNLQLCNSGAVDPTPFPGMVIWDKSDQSEYCTLLNIEIGSRKATWPKARPILANKTQFHDFCWNSWDGGIFRSSCWTVVLQPRATGSHLATMRRQSLENGVYLEGKQKRHAKSKTNFWWHCLSPRSRLAWSLSLDFSVFWPINSFSL